MEEPKLNPFAHHGTQQGTPEEKVAGTFDRPERTEHSVMEGLPLAKQERIAAMRRDLAEAQRRLIEADQRIATELQGRAEDAERYEALETRLQAQERQYAERTGELQTEIEGMRSQLATAAETAQQLRGDVTARNTQLEDIRRQHRDVSELLAAESSSLRETKTLLETRDGELATMTKDRDAEQGTRSRVERELDEQRKQHRDVTEQLAAMTSQRDSLKAELEQTQRELDTVGTKALDVVQQIQRLGEDLVKVVGNGPPRAEPPPQQPPPEPPQTETPKLTGSRSGRGLLMIGGVILACAAFVIVAKASSNKADRKEVDPLPSSAVVAPVATPPSTTDVNAQPKAQPKDETAPAAAAASATDGVIVLPAGAAGHRVFVDGRPIEVDNSRATVPCGNREIRIGRRGAPRKLDVACGGETALPADR